MYISETTRLWLVSCQREQTIAEGQTWSIIQRQLINMVKPRPDLVSDHTDSSSIAVVCTCLCGRVSITRCERLCYIVGPPDKEKPRTHQGHSSVSRTKAGLSATVTICERRSHLQLQKSSQDKFKLVLNCSYITSLHCFTESLNASCEKVIRKRQYC